MGSKAMPTGALVFIIILVYILIFLMTRFAIVNIFHVIVMYELVVLNNFDPIICVESSDTSSPAASVRIE